MAAPGRAGGWLMVDLLAVGVAVVAVVVGFWYSRRQTRIANESKNIAAQAREDARRSADAAEESAKSARRVVEIEARRDHDRIRDDVTLVDVAEERRRELDYTDRVVVLRNAGQRIFRYRAWVYFPQNGSTELGGGEAWRPGEDVRLFLGSAEQQYSHVEVWFDGECPCHTGDGERGHWRITFQVPPVHRTRIRRAQVGRRGSPSGG